MSEKSRAAALDVIVALRAFEQEVALYPEERRQVNDMIQTMTKYIK